MLDDDHQGRRLRGGGDPDAEDDEMFGSNPRRLAELIVRGTPKRASGSAVERDGSVIEFE